MKHRAEGGKERGMMTLQQVNVLIGFIVAVCGVVSVVLGIKLIAININA